MPEVINLADSDDDNDGDIFRRSNGDKHEGSKISRTKYNNNENDADSDYCEIDEQRSGPSTSLGPKTVLYAGSAGSAFSFSSQYTRQLLGRPSATAISPQPQSSQSKGPMRAVLQRSPARPGARANLNVYPMLPGGGSRALQAETAQLSVPISKLRIAHKDSLHRHVDVRPSRRCTNCIQDGRCCDGEAPCAICFDPGFACVYPGEEPVTSSREPTTKTAEAFQDSRISSSDEWTAEYDREQFLKTVAEHQSSNSPSSKASLSPSSVSSKDVQHGGRIRSRASSLFTKGIVKGKIQNSEDISRQDRNPERITNVSEDVQMLLQEQADNESDTTDNNGTDLNPATDVNMLKLESIPDTSWLPNSLEDVRRLIRTHEANINNHREYIVEARLANAKVTSRRDIHINTEKRGANPFKRMIADQPRLPSSESSSTILNMRVKARRSDYTNLKVPVAELGEDEAAHIPEYKSIGRLRSIFLARNVHGLKFVPYNSGIEEKDLDQRRKDLETRFKDYGSEEFRRQRECLELVYQWSDDFGKILQELRISRLQLWSWLLQNGLTKCPKCETSCGNRPASRTVHAESSKAVKQRCYWLHEAMMKTTHIGLWHFLSPKPGQIEKNLNGEGHSAKKEHLLCSLCFTHNCLTHGSFLDEDIVLGEAVINDPEQQNNKRHRAVLRIDEQNASRHVCGLYCLPEWWNSKREDTRDIIGLDDEGQLVGLRNKSISMLTDLGSFQGHKPCAQACFLEKINRTKAPNPSSFNERFDIIVIERVVRLSRLYSSHLRLPCMISKLSGKDCATSFHILVQFVNSRHAQAKIDQLSDTSETAEGRKMSAKAAGYNTGKSSVLEERKTWVPCSHIGPCLSTHSGCACAREQVHCEEACGCSERCRRRFRGCRCKKTCFLDDRCDCYAANRECDPMLCHDCGVEEVLDPSNKYRDDIRNGRCRNNRLQLDLPPRTVIGMSEVQGWGLFLGEDLPGNTFIGEYKGEKISTSESDRRGAIYAYVGQEYLFNLNKDNQLDGSRFGNKTRFINNSKVKEFINLFPKVMFVNGVTKIGLFTSRAITAGEELLYDYGYPPEVVKDEFWEKHERAIEHNGVVTPIAKPKFRPRMAKNAVDTPGQEEDEDDDEPIPVRKNLRSSSKGKRKRRLEEIFADSDEEDNRAARHVSAQNATDSSDYEENGEDEQASTNGDATSHESGVEEVDESEDELSIPTRRDRRFGGEAQRRGARTRRMNKQQGSKAHAPRSSRR